MARDSTAPAADAPGVDASVPKKSKAKKTTTGAADSVAATAAASTATTTAAAGGRIARAKAANPLQLKRATQSLSVSVREPNVFDNIYEYALQVGSPRTS